MKYISKYIIHTNQTQCFEYSTEYTPQKVHETLN